MITKRHLRPLGEDRRNITARVRRHIEALGQVHSGVRGVRESDEVGHIVSDLLGGPHDRTYNFIAQSPQCNMQYYHKVEKPIYDYLSARDDDAFVFIDVQMMYVDYLAGVSPDRPRAIKVFVWYNSTVKSFEFSNM